MGNDTSEVVLVMQERRLVWQAIQDYIDLMGYGPTFDELEAITGLGQRAIKRHLDILRANEVLDYQNRLPRSLRILRRTESGSGS